jgi:hypothetical protein
MISPGTAHLGHERVVGHDVLRRVGQGHRGDGERVDCADQRDHRGVRDARVLHGPADLLEELTFQDVDHEHGFSPFGGKTPGGG